MEKKPLETVRDISRHWHAKGFKNAKLNNVSV